MPTVIHQLRTVQKPLDGMSYVIQCSDSSLIVVDGGMDQGDADKLIGFLKKITGEEKPVVEAWFITHNHADHTLCFIDFAERLTDSLTVKKLVFNFMPDDFYLNAEPACIPERIRFEAAADRLPGLERVTPKSGDVCTYGDTKIEFLFSASETKVVNGGKGMTVNDTSLVFRVWADGQSVLFLGDVENGGNEVLIEKYGKALKSDVCQVAHHGFVSSTSEFYDIVDPEILLWPSGVRNLKVYCSQIETDRHLVKDLHVRDVYLAGNGDVSLEMPIKPRKEPFIPNVWDSVLRELTPDLTVNKASRAPSLDDPFDPEWYASPRFEAKNDLWGKGGPGEDTAFFRILWSEDALYVKARFNKTPVSDPARFDSMRSDCVRFSLTERPIRDNLSFWKHFAADPYFIEKIRFYHEPKNIGGKALINSLPERCESRSFADENGFTVCAAISFCGHHVPGDIIGFNIEFNGIRSPGAVRAYSLSFAAEGDFLPYHITPSSLAFAELKSKD